MSYLDLANPQVLRAFIDAATQGAALNQLVGIALVFLAIALTSQFVLVGETYLAEDVGLTATNAMRADLTLHCLRLDPAFHASHTPGELIERVDGDINTLSNFFARFVVYVVGNGLLVAEDGNAVHSVMIGGRMVVENRRVLTVDLTRLRDRAEAARERLAAANADNRRLYEALEPIVGSYCPGLARQPYHVHRYIGRPD